MPGRGEAESPNRRSRALRYPEDAAVGRAGTDRDFPGVVEGATVRAANGNSYVVLAMALLIGVALFGGRVASGRAQPATAHQKLTIYAVATTAQFMNHADDRIRGMSNNPFSPNAQALVIVAKGQEKGNGPFPGDDVLYSFKLHSSADGKTNAGSAIFTCYYDFFKRATCDAYFELKGGVMLASGLVVFSSTRFTLAVTGGTGKYLGVNGEVLATPAAHNAQRLAFVLG